MEAVQIIALTMGLAWASGINLYAAIAILGVLGATGNMVLPPGLEVTQHPAVIVAAGFMYCVEFFADKVPGVDTVWDTIHTFIRIPAAAILAAGAVWHVDPAMALVAGSWAAFWVRPATCSRPARAWRSMPRPSLSATSAHP